MTDAEVAAQVARTDAFIAEVRELISTTTTDPASACADYHRSGIRRIAETLDAVDYVTLANLANVDTVMGGMLLELIELKLMCVGAGPSLDFASATAFFAEFQPMINVGLRRYRN